MTNNQFGLLGYLAKLPSEMTHYTYDQAVSKYSRYGESWRKLVSNPDVIGVAASGSNSGGLVKGMRRRNREINPLGGLTLGLCVTQ